MAFIKVSGPPRFELRTATYEASILPLDYEVLPRLVAPAGNIWQP